MSNYPPSSDPWSGGGNQGPSGPPLASWGQRLGAYLVDGLIGGGIVVVGVILGAVLGTVSDALGVFFVVVGILAGLGFVVWNLIQQGQTGQTVGKKMLDIRLVRLDGQTPPGIGLSFGRYLLHVFIDSAICYLGFLWPLWDQKRQTFADKIVNTVVVTA
ncbi:MAG: hypothetical protein QOG43_2555 [Actinomycetota bacterium]|jgi:uncharacterized RDD family membrane protein YckC|nr:hypothetical protein [Actinomycetota bacterium]